jgi:hypothetical protein
VVVLVLVLVVLVLVLVLVLVWCCIGVVVVFYKPPATKTYCNYCTVNIVISNTRILCH